MGPRRFSELVHTPGGIEHSTAATGGMVAWPLYSEDPPYKELARAELVG